MRDIRLTRLAAGLLVLTVAASVSSSTAEVKDQSMNVEIFGGSYAPGPDLDDETIWGLRWGFDISPRFGMQTELSFVGLDETFSGPLISGNIDVDFTFIDISFMGFLFPDKRASVSLFGGAGGAFSSIDGSLSGPGGTLFFNNLADDSFTVHAGTDVRIQLGENFYLRPGARIRWFEGREDDETDGEYTLALGWNFGG
jgi:hypothetical protein